jgi:hypothetical protein
MATCKYSDWTNGQEEALKNILGGDEVCRKILSGKVKVTIEEIKDLLLAFVAEVYVLATTGKFVAVEMFVRDVSHKAKVKISYLGDNFTKWFLNGKGKTEDPITKQTLYFGKLRKSSVDGPIIDELGGEANAETTLTELYGLMKLQANGEEGALLTNGWWNIFYIKDQNGALRAVSVGWRGGGWRVGAGSVECPVDWRDGYQVLSRNSVLKPSDTAAPAKA